MSDLFRLDDRVAVVTGASRGLGRAMALGLASAGADVVAIATTRKRAAIFLASAASDYVTGHVLLVDGGWMAR